MALGDNYATLDELKAYMSLTGQASMDDQMTDALTTASREIERHCNRQFNNTGTASARVYAPTLPRVVRCDDFYTTTGLILESDDSGDGTFPTVWTSAQYELEPVNGIVDGQLGWPYNKFRALSGLWFPRPWTMRRNVVRVTAKWGWAEVPAPVKQACLLLAAENFQLKDAPLGVAGMGEFGVVRVRNNRMAADKLNRYCRESALVG
jgi:hypothetical protein